MAMSDTDPPRRPRPFLLRPGVVLAEVALIALLVLAIVLALRQGSTDDAARAQLPDSIAGLGLVDYVEGEEATASMSQLHIRGIVVADGYIGHYEGGSTVWVGLTEGEAHAQELLQAMTVRIGEGGSPFSVPQPLEMEGKTVYILVGEGQEHHFYYQTGRAVIWVQLPSSNIDAFTREALRLLHD
jgi:hypothetical protein